MREPVDTDLLADHLGGALAGTPDEARVAHLIATDPGWARAAGELAGALDAVATDLGAVGPPPAMPDDIAARMDAVLQSLSPAPTASHPSPGQGGQGPSGQRPPDRRPGAKPRAARRRRGDSGPARTRRRTRWGAALAGLAAVVAFAAIGLGPLGLAGSLTGSATDSAGGGNAEPPAAADGDDSADTLEQAPEEAAPEGGTYGTLPKAASGQDYVPGSPLLARNSLRNAPVAPEVDQERPDEPLPTGGEVPDELAPLWKDPDPCVRAIRANYQPAQVEIELLDFARFEGHPAVVIWLTADDRREVLVAGPDCGKPATGMDERYRAELD